MASKTFTRNELYALVWATPMRTLAKGFGLSDVGLAKICRKHGIPTPPLGFWAKKQYGKPARQAPLPPSDDNESITITAQQPRPSAPAHPEPRTVRDPAIAALIVEAIKPENKVVAAATLHGLHPLVAATRTGFEAAEAQTYGLVSPGLVGGKRCLDITVSPGAVNRALRLMNAVFKALERLGLTFTHATGEWRRELHLVIAGEAVFVRLREKTKRRDHVPTDVEMRERRGSPFLSANRGYDYVPTNVFDLRLSASGHYYSPARAWVDRSAHPIEDQLTDVVVAVLELADGTKVARAEREREERIERKRQSRRDKLEERRERERTRIKKLHAKARAWRRSRRLREYIAAVRDDATRSGGIEPDGKLDRWLKWAVEQADRLDPLVESPPSVLDRDPELDGY